MICARRAVIIVALGSFAVFAALHAQCHAASPSWPPTGWSEPATQDRNQDRAELSANQNSLPIGGVLELTALLHSGRQSDSVYNPFFNPEFLLPARIVVFDARKRYVADLLPFQEPARLPPYSVWFPMSEGHVFGRRLRIWIPDGRANSTLGNRPESELAVSLAPGKCYLQLIYTNRLRSIRPSSAYPDALQRWLQPSHDAERLRSNIVAINILARDQDRQERTVDAPDSIGTGAPIDGRTPASGRRDAPEPAVQACEFGMADLPRIAGIPQPTSPAISDFQLLEQEDLNCGTFRGRTTISVPQRRLVSGIDQLVVHALFENMSDVGYQVNDPTWHVSPAIIFRPAVLAIFDQEKNCLGDLFEASSGSGGNPWNEVWKHLPAGAICSVRHNKMAGAVYPSARNPKAILPPGKYYVQLVYLERFIAPPPGSDVEPPPPDAGPETLQDYEKRLRESMMQWPAKYGRPLFRSNVVEIQLLDKPDPPPIAGAGPDTVIR